MKLINTLTLLLGLFTFANTATAQTISDIKVNQLKTFITDDSELVIIDVRTANETAQGTIEGAINIDLYTDFENQIENLDKNKTYLVYCRSGKRSARSANIMANAGFSKVYNLLGGYRAWEAAL